nr:hypothetical protein Iba_chr15aCG6800 [Ipomoea batatas]
MASEITPTRATRVSCVVTMSSSPSPPRGGEYCASREEEDLVMLSSNGSFIPSTFENNNLQEGNKAKEMEINNNNDNKGLFQCKANGTVLVCVRNISITLSPFLQKAIKGASVFHLSPDLFLPQILV